MCTEHFFCRSQSYCDDPDLVLELKNLIVIFADTLQVGSELRILCFDQTLTPKGCETTKWFSQTSARVITGLRFPSEPAV